MDMVVGSIAAVLNMIGSYVSAVESDLMCVADDSSRGKILDHRHNLYTWACI